jgi:hypothetical protein
MAQELGAGGVGRKVSPATTSPAGGDVDGRPSAFSSASIRWRLTS